MIYRKLGHTDIEISTVGFGAWAIGGWMWGRADEHDSIKAIHAALDNGVNLIDTAPIYGYGHSEEVVAKAIHDRRDKVVVATKCGLIWDREEGQFHFHANQAGISLEPSEKKVFKCLKPQSLRQEVERSLKRLGTTYIDLYQTHWQESTTPIADTMATLLKMRDEGKIRAIGVSNANLEQLKAYGPIDSDQEKFSLIDRKMEKDGTLAYCREQSISVLAYSPLANGLLTGKIRPDRQYEEGDLRRGNPRFTASNVERVNNALDTLRPIADHHRASIGQLIIAWTFTQPGLTCVLCGARNPQQAVENAAAGDISLSEEEQTTIGRNLVA
jgi:aryl-alcohol dehydrogenase-like predicted oxidoreductase